ncbi:LLM class flavin-dependent oxidoreductase [Brevibacterium daeguense]|uniref:LLM class flavin-dependent oxidoreductase n=2 Tax=Brevibacterium daeguense TaxID=909936 RepID=A0ABP8EH61_9MICO
MNIAMAADGMILNAFPLGAGHHESAWRHRLAPAYAAEADPEHFIGLAKIAERGKFHSFFLADLLYLNEYVSVNSLQYIEPITTLAAISQHTSRIGLVATISTAFFPPYHLARIISGLDSVSGGRFGWNIVTSSQDAEAQNFGIETLPDHDLRYETAADYTRTVLDLLEAWEDDALVRDQRSGLYADVTKIDFGPKGHGKFHVAGPLNLAPSPQRRPALFQAGRSSAGVDFAGRFADAVFSVQKTFDSSAEFRHQLREKARAHGRSPDDINLLPGVWPFIGSTEREAQQLFEELEELVLPAQVADFIAYFTGLDLTDHGFDEPLPPLPDGAFQGQIGRYTKIQKLVAQGHDTLRKLQKAFGSTRGHQYLVGTPEQIAASMADWFRRGAVDGFAVQAPILPHGLEQFVDHIVPELQKLGVFREDYPAEQQTLRSALRGSAQPASIST